MPFILQQSTIDDKTLELCQHIIDDPAFSTARGRIENFLGDDQAQSVYKAWQEKAHDFHMKGHSGIEPGEAEMVEMKLLEGAMEGNQVAAEFAEAEEQLNTIFTTVAKMVQKTLQLGRVPSDEDFAESGCCSEGGCGCDH